MTKTRILLLEDSPLDTELTLATLKDGGLQFDVTQANNRESFLLALQQGEYEIILSDYALGGPDGIGALEIAKVTVPTIPFIFVSDRLGEDLAIEAIKNGATDYVLKQNLRRITPAIERALRIKENVRSTQEVNAEHELLATIIANFPGVVWEMEGSLEDHRCTYVSPYIEKLTGYTQEEWKANKELTPIIGSRIVHKDDLSEVVRQLEKIQDADDPGIFQFRWIRRDGDPLWMESYVRLVKSGEKIVGLRGVSIDITQRKTIERDRDHLLENIERSRDRISSLLESVEEREQRYKMIADSMPVIVWSTKPDGTPLYLNRQWETHTGAARESALENAFEEFIHPDDFLVMFELWEKALRTQENFETEIRIRDASGAFPWFLVRAVPIFSQNHEIVQWIGTSTPVDEQKRARENFRFIAEASAILGSSLDFETTLRSVARLAVPQMADWCTVDMVNPNGKVDRLAVAHIDPAKVAWSYEIQEKYPPNRDAPNGVPNVIRTGKSEFYPLITDEMIMSSDLEEEHKQMLQKLGFRSAIIVPVVARDFILGAISLASAESGKRFTEDDLALAEDLGRRAGTAIDNAWLYRKSQEEIAERTRIEGEVRLSEARFRTLVEQSPLSIQIYSSDGYCLQANEAFSKLFGIDPAELLGYNIFEDEQLAKRGMLPYLERAFKGEPVTVAAVYYDPEEDGTKGRGRWVRAFSYPIKEASGELKEVALILEDITDRFEAEETLRKAKEAAEAANQAKDKFLAILSHELRTPLTPVLTSVQILEMDKNLPEEYRQWVEVIHRNVELEARLIDDLLDLTRISKGKLKLNRERVDIHRLIEHVIDIYRTELDNKHLTLSLELKASHSFVEGDPARLQQVLWNLLKNAVKFTPSKGVIVISSSDEEQMVRVAIKDSGIGIDPDTLPRIFDAFEQGEQTVTRHFGGLGLGLAICKNLVEIHAGKIKAESDGRDKGAVFTILLPITIAEVKEPSYRIPAVPPTPRSNGEKHSVLLVDDHADTSLALKLLLERRGFNVITAENVEKALQAIRESKENGVMFDLIISDIGLPDRSGLELMEQVREELPEMKAIALSGFGTDEDIRRSKEAGFAEHLTKPFNFQKLEEVVQHLLS